MHPTPPSRRAPARTDDFPAAAPSRPASRVSAHITALISICLLGCMLAACLALTAFASPARAGDSTATASASATPAAPTAPTADPTELVAAWPPAPPWRTLARNRPGGRELALARALAEQLGLNLRIVPCADRREALELLRTGRADVVTGLAALPDRPDEVPVARFAEPALRTSSETAFYARPGVRPVRRLDDLLGLRIAVARGVPLFPEFDADARMQRLSLATVRAALTLTASGQADVAALPADEADYWIRRLRLEAAVRPCAYSAPGEAPVRLAVSAASPLAARLPEMEQALRGWRSSGRLDELLAPVPPPDAP